MAGADKEYKFVLARMENGCVISIWDLKDCSDTGYVLVDLVHGVAYLDYFPEEAHKDE